VAEVRALKARKICNINVGCMQINLYYHPDAFADLEAALDPASNVAYAAGYLKNLRTSQGSWTRAAGA
jgi:soluble lytic murein transglycosylase-like protein